MDGGGLTWVVSCCCIVCVSVTVIPMSVPIVSYTYFIGMVSRSSLLQRRYLPNQHCVWTIAIDSPLEVSFERFDLEEPFDYVRVFQVFRDGSDEQLLLVASGTEVPATVTVPSGLVRVEFRSDVSDERTGFEAAWTALAPTAAGSRPSRLIGAALRANTSYWPTLLTGQHYLRANTTYGPTLLTGQHYLLANITKLRPLASILLGVNTTVDQHKLLAVVQAR